MELWKVMIDVYKSHVSKRYPSTTLTPPFLSLLLYGDSPSTPNPKLKLRLDAFRSPEAPPDAALIPLPALTIISARSVSLPEGVLTSRPTMRWSRSWSSRFVAEGQKETHVRD